MEVGEFRHEEKGSSLPKGLQLQNKFAALRVDEDPDVPSSKGTGLPDTKPCMTTMKKQ